MKVALYARVSSERQAEKDLSISAQLKALRKHAAENGWEVHREFVDEAESARTANRPAFQEMIGLARQRGRPFEAILVWKLSRFARNREDSIIYKSLLKRHGVSVVSINERIDESPGGKLFEGMIEVIDEFYSTNLAQDTVRGMRENASRGHFNGGTVPTGYRAARVTEGGVPKTRLELDETWAPVVKRVFDMSLSGKGMKEIAQTLNAEGLKTMNGGTWNTTGIHYILTNPVYTGRLVWNRHGKRAGGIAANDAGDFTTVTDAHPRIIDDETYNRAQALLRKRSPRVTHPRTINSEYLLSGLLHCGKCGASMTGCSAKSSRFHYYACRTRYTRGRTCCDTGMVNRDRLDAFVIDRLRTNIVTEENLAEWVRLTNEEMAQARQELAGQLRGIDHQIDQLQKRLSKRYDALETGRLELDDLAPRIKELKAQMDTRQQTRNAPIAETDGDGVPLLSPSDISAQARDLQDLLHHGTIVERKGFVRSFVKRVEVNGKQATVEYTIPLRTGKADPPNVEVLPIVPNGSPPRIRTRNPLVNSQSLYR